MRLLGRCRGGGLVGLTLARRLWVGAAGLVSPEAMLASAPFTLGFLNGVTSLVEYGLTYCSDGWGSKQAVQGQRPCKDTPSKRQSAVGNLNYTAALGASAASVVAELESISRVTPQRSSLHSLEEEHGGDALDSLLG